MTASFAGEPSTPNVELDIDNRSSVFGSFDTANETCNLPDCGGLTNEPYEPEGKERSCDTLLMCIVTALNQGIRNGGGLGDVLRYPSIQEPLYAARVVYDLLYFFVIIIIVLNLIFGVIIDTFADLRSEKTMKEEILKNSCFICGMYILMKVLRFMVLCMFVVCCQAYCTIARVFYGLRNTAV